jgi:hypothetical protein
VHIPRLRTLAVTGATTALALGGLVAGAGTASAATTLHCDNGWVALAPGAVGFTGCDTTELPGGPYTVNTDTLYLSTTVTPGSPHVNNAVVTCQNVTYGVPVFFGPLWSGATCTW